MPRTYSSVEKIRAELAWLNEPVDPNVCGCRHMLCCEQTGHALAKCPNKPTEKIWSFQQEYLCADLPLLSLWRGANARLHDCEIVTRGSLLAARAIRCGSI